MSNGTRTVEMPATGRAQARPVAAHEVSNLRRLSALAVHLLRRQIVNALIWGGVLGLLGAMYVALFPSMGSELDQYMESLPEGMKAFFPSVGATGSVEAWLNMELFSLTAPLALPFFLLIIGARAIAGREERGTMDLLLSNPVPRWVLVAATYLTMVAALLVALVPLFVLTWLPSLTVDVQLSAWSLAQGVLNLLPFCLFFGSLALLLSALVRRAALAIALPAAVLVGMYVLQGLANYSDKIEPLQPLSLFSHYGSAIQEGIDWLRFTAIVLLGLVLMALAMLAFHRRQIYT